MPSGRNFPAGLISVGQQRLITNSTSTALNSTMQTGSALIFSVEAKAIRVTFDGSTPTANTGVLLTTTQSPYRYEGINIAQFKIARAASGAIVMAASLKRPGDKAV